jgi:hypothetical protein
MTNKSVPKKSDFGEKSDFSNRAQTCPKNDKQIRCPRNPILGKNRISQTVPKRAQKMTNKSAAQEIRFWGKIGFLKPCINPIFGKNRISQTVPKRAKKMTNKSAAQEIRFWGKIGFIYFEKTEFINGLDIGAILH